MTNPSRRPRRRAQGQLEAQVWEALHQADEPVTAGWVRERVPGDLAYTTVVTILARLLTKGAVTRVRAGRSFLWTPTADGAGLAALKMHRVLDSEPDREAVLASFLVSLSDSDEQVVRELLARTEDSTDDADGDGTVG
ncbi:BlaI/MecI/CopY family transcriptional regulator [Streptomyces sp. NPDC051784]|uniref:BlaI/MecI/CopY family transcriptional regulator n=1 Tax=Streptomyces sp. NPDC051784 TaxID=3155805 RepID=UPI00343B4A9C